MKAKFVALPLAAALVTAFCGSALADPVTFDFTIVSPSPPPPQFRHQYNELMGITDAGVAAGYSFVSGPGITGISNSGYASRGMIRQADGTQSFFDADLAALNSNGTFFNAINNGGTIVGTYYTGGFSPFTFAAHPFLRAPDGTFTDLAPPPASSSYQPSGINDAGMIVGYADASGGTRGFIRDVDGTYSLPFDAPGATGPFPQTFAYDINNLGDVVGNCVCDGVFKSFIRLADGTFIKFAHPDFAETRAYGMNDEGLVVGSVGGGGTGHSFVYNYLTGEYTVFDPIFPGPDEAGHPMTSFGSQARGINNDGVIVGDMVDAFHLEGYSYIATPPLLVAAPEPASLAVMGLGLLALGATRRRKA